MTAGTTTGALKTERLLNLVMVLLYTRRPLTKAQIRRLVGQYDTSPSVEAFERMFERDKDELRALGVPLATTCLLYTSPSPRDRTRSRMPSSA